MRRGLLLLGLTMALAASRLEAQGPRGLSLEEALRLAIPASEPLGLARAEVTRAHGEELRARSEFFPQLTGSASYTRQLRSQFSALQTDETPTDDPPRPDRCDRFFADPTRPIAERVDSLESTVECLSSVNPFGAFRNLPFGRENTYRLGLAFSQTLWTGGRLGGQARAARAARESAEIGLEAAEAELTLDVVRTYFDAVLAEQLAAIARTALEQADSALRHTQARRAVGTSAEFDLLRARVARDNQRALVIERASAHELAVLRLRQLLDLPPGDSLVLTTPLADTSLAAIEPLAPLLAARGDTTPERRAPVRQAAEGVAAREGLLRAARSQRLPSVSLTSTFARLAYPNSGFPGWGEFVSDWSVGLGLQVPIFTGGRIRGDRVVAEAGLAEARTRLKQITELAQLDARSAATELASAEAKLLASVGTSEEADRAYRIAELRYQEGISTQTELLDARLALEQARATRAQAARDAQIARIRLALLPSLPFSQ